MILIKIDQNLMKTSHYVQWKVELWFCVGDKTLEEVDPLRKNILCVRLDPGIYYFPYLLNINSFINI